MEKQIKAAIKLLTATRNKIDKLLAELAGAVAFAVIVGIALVALSAPVASAATQTTVFLQEGTPVVLSTTYAAATTAGDSFANDGRTFFAVKNGSGSAVTVTITPGNATRAVPGVGVVTKSTVTVSVPSTTGETLIGPFPPSFYNDASGNVNVTYSAVTSVTVAAVRLVLTQ